MNKVFCLVALVSALLCSCVSRNYRAVAALGQSFECVATPHTMAKMRDGWPDYVVGPRSTDKSIKIYQVGNAYYTPAIRAAFKKDFGSYPVVGIGSEGEVLGPRKRCYRYEKGCEETQGYCRVVKKNKYEWSLVTEGEQAWLPGLPNNAVALRLKKGEYVNSFARCPGMKHHWYAVATYPLSLLTLVGVDMPCALVGNVLVGMVWIPIYIEEDLLRRPGQQAAPEM